jgi:hypothetical protein
LCYFEKKQSWRRFFDIKRTEIKGEIENIVLIFTIVQYGNKWRSKSEKKNGPWTCICRTRSLVTTGSPFSGVLRPFSGVLRPFSGVLRPFSGVLRPFSRVFGAQPSAKADNFLILGSRRSIFLGFFLLLF